MIARLWYFGQPRKHHVPQNAGDSSFQRNTEFYWYLLIQNFCIIVIFVSNFYYVAFFIMLYVHNQMASN